MKYNQNEKMNVFHIQNNMCFYVFTPQQKMIACDSNNDNDYDDDMDGKETKLNYSYIS